MKYFIACMLMSLVLNDTGCNNDHSLQLGPLGPEVLSIIVSDGETPVFSWSGGPVCTITVSRTDTTFIDEPLEGLIREKAPCVWGCRTVDENGEKIDGIHSPVTFGTRFENALDLSDSLFRKSALDAGEQYYAHIVDVGPGSVGNTTFTVINKKKE